MDSFGSIAWFYRDLYLEDSPTGHLFTTRLQRVFELVGEICEKSVLDVGCGPCMTSPYFLSHGCNFYGIDLSREMLKVCRDKSGTPVRVNVGVGNMKELPFPDSSFDIILCLGALEYVDSPDIALREFSRVLRQDGTMILSMQNKSSPYRLWDIHIYHSNFANYLRKILKGTFAERPVEKIFSFQEFRQLCERNFLAVKDVTYYDFNLWLKPLDQHFPHAEIITATKLETLYRSKFGVLGTGFIVKVEKATQCTQNSQYRH